MTLLQEDNKDLLQEFVRHVLQTVNARRTGKLLLEARDVLADADLERCQETRRSFESAELFK